MMVKKIFFLLSFFGMVSCGLGQKLLLMKKDTSFLTAKSYLEINAQGDWHSNSLNNLFAERMVLGGYIDQEMIDFIDEDLESFNRMGGNLFAGMQLYSFNDSLFKKNKWGLKVKVEQRSEGFVSFSKDLFHLVFEGNTTYKGQELDLSNTNISLFTYQKMGIGIFNKRDFSEITLSMINGQSFVQLQIPNASFYTTDIGDTLILNAQGFAHRSNPNRSGFGISNGVGMALDFKANIPLYDQKGYILLEMNNLGFIHWNKKSVRQEIDTTNSYVGIDIHDLLDAQNTSSSFAVFDSTFYSSDTLGLYTWLPTYGKVSLLRYFKEKDYLELGIIVRAYRAFIPQLFVGYNYFMTDNAQVGLKASYGGYGKFRIGASYEQFWKNWYFTVSTNDLPGLILNDAKGRGAAFSVGKFFGKQRQ